MDEARGVRGIEGCGDLCQQVQRALGLQATVSLEGLAKVRALDVGHRQIQDPVVLAGPDCRDDVRMIETGGQLRFAQETLPKALVPRQLRSKHLQGDLVAAARLLGEVDGAHRALADQRHDPEAGHDRAGGHRRPHRLHRAWQARAGISS